MRAGLKKDAMQTCTVAERSLSVAYSPVCLISSHHVCIHTPAHCTLDKTPTVGSITSCALSDVFRTTPATVSSCSVNIFILFLQLWMTELHESTCMLFGCDAFLEQPVKLTGLSTVIASAVNSSVHWLPAHAFQDLIMNCKTLSATNQA